MDQEETGSSSLSILLESDVASSLTTCGTLAWTRCILHNIVKTAHRRDMHICPHLWSVLQSVDRTLFGAEYGPVMKTFPFLPRSDSPTLQQLFRFDVLLLHALDLQPGHSLLVIQESGLGYVNHVAGYLLAPGGSNVALLRKRLAVASRDLDAILRRLDPRGRRGMVSPVFTASVAEALCRRYDRIVVYDRSANEDDVDVLRTRLRVGGKLFCMVAHKRHDIDFVQLRRADERSFDRAACPFEHPLLRDAPRRMAWDLAKVDAEVTWGTPPSLLLSSLRTLAWMADPVGCLLASGPARLQSKFVCGAPNLDRHRGCVEALEESFARLVEGEGRPAAVEPLSAEEKERRADRETEATFRDFHAAHTGFLELLRSRHSPCSCPYRDRMCETMGVALDVLRGQLRSLSDVVWPEEDDAIDRQTTDRRPASGQRGAPPVTTPSLLVQELTTTASRLVSDARSFLSGLLWPDEVVSATEKQRRLCRHRREFLSEIRRLRASAALPAAPDRASLVDQLSLTGARLASDARALQRLLSCPLTRRLPHRTDPVSVKWQVAQLLRAFDAGRLQERLFNAKEAKEELLRGCPRTGIGSAVPVRLPAHVPTTLRAGLHALVNSVSGNLDLVAQMQSYTAACDWRRLDQQLGALDAQIPAQFASCADLRGFLAARALWDGAEAVTAARRERAEAEVAKLTTSAAVFLQQVLSGLATPARRALLQQVDADAVFR